MSKGKMLVLALMLILPLAAWFAGCSTHIPPLIPTPPSVSPTPTVDIFWDKAVLYDYSTGVSFRMSLSVNGTAYTSAAVTITSAGTNYPVVFMGTNGTEALYQAGNLTAIPGQIYTLTTTALGCTASAALTMAGPATISADGYTVSWSNGGTSQEVQVWDETTTAFTYDSYQGGTILTSPFIIPTAAYPTTSTNYITTVELISSTTAISGADSASSYSLVYPKAAGINK